MNILNLKQNLYKSKSIEDIKYSIEEITAFRNQIDFKKMEPNLALDIKDKISNYIQKYLA